MAAMLAAASMCAQSASVEEGRQLYRTHCFVCHGEDGESIPGVNLRSGQFRRVSSDDEISRLIINGIPGTGMPPTNLAEPQRRLLVAYIRSMNTSGNGKGNGDAVLGRTVFEGKGGCLVCHRVGAQGSHLGPDLTAIGSLRTAANLERAILDPNETIAAQNRFIRAVTRDGTVITGRRLNEDTHTVQLIDEKERLISVEKADLREYTLLKTSPMPSYRDKLSPAEVAGLVSYLLSLKGSQ